MATEASNTMNGWTFGKKSIIPDTPRKKLQKKLIVKQLDNLLKGGVWVKFENVERKDSGKEKVKNSKGKY